MLNKEKFHQWAKYFGGFATIWGIFYMFVLIVSNIVIARGSSELWGIPVLNVKNTMATIVFLSPAVAALAIYLLLRKCRNNP